MKTPKHRISFSPAFPGRTLAAVTLAACSYITIAQTTDPFDEAVIAFGRGDVVSAMMNYRTAAEAGNPTAMARLAYLLDQSEENAEAFEWYTKSAEMHDPEGQYGLAEMYVTGDAGEQNFDKARELIQAAAEAGYISAMRNLAVAYERGSIGLQINQEKVIYWLEQGAAKNDPWSVDRLANAYQKGETGLQPDEAKAKYWRDRLKAINSAR